MPTIDVLRETELSQSIRARQVSAMFDAPLEEKCTLVWKGDFPVEDSEWHVGLIVGPSGSGKSTIANEVFGEHVQFEWGKPSVLDDFASDATIESIARVCQAVGFNTIPAWLRPYGVLSTGERFRVDLARRLLELPDPIVCDEFTSVVDRQVAQVGSHAVQKYIRKHDRKFVAVSCHYDIIDWLQPDWIFEPGTMSFRRRCLRRRPDIECTICRVPYSYWRVFAPYHYLTAHLHKAAKCYSLFVDDQITSIAAVLHRPHPKVRDIMGISRLVTLPDWQGIGLAFVLIDTIGAAYKTIGKRLHIYPAHPALIHSLDRSKMWKLVRRPCSYVRSGSTSTVSHLGQERPCATFAYCGEAMPNTSTARRLLGA